MDEFESLLSGCRNALERFVNFRLPPNADREDIVQEVCIKAYRRFNSLRDKTKFKAWLIAIARNECNEYFRKAAKSMEIPLETLCDTIFVCGRSGITEKSAVCDALDLLGDKEKQILYLYYFKDLPQAELANHLNIPLGTVKSRLHKAKQSFKEIYPYQPKGDIIMNKMPEIMPKYTIVKSDKEPFFVRWEEIMGWFLVPKLGEKLRWAMYDFPERQRTEYVDMEVIGKAEVHGIEGVEIVAVEHEPMGVNSPDGRAEVERRFVAQLTDTHCRLLAESDYDAEDGVKRFYTFLDGDEFLDNWGFGEDNCGNEIAIVPHGDITRKGNEITTADKKFLLDVVGRYTVTIGGKSYDTICVMDIETYNGGVATEQYIDRNGKTVLWRRFNRDNWAIKKTKQLWSEKLPDNERIRINGETYVHWYDCISDYIL